MDEVADTTRAQVARAGAALFAAAGLITGLGLVLPHQPEADEAGLAALTVVCLIVAAVFWFPRHLSTPVLHAGCVAGTLFVSFSVLFNGERLGGAAGNDEMYYMWVALFVAYYLGRAAVAAHVAVIAVAYAITVAAVAPSGVALSRYVSTIGLVVGTSVVVRLLSERVDRLVAVLRDAARTDPLTALPNRRAFEEAYDRATAQADRHGGRISLLLADLDRFKQVNDNFGHHAGDALLVRVGGTLHGSARASDTVARFGGDEFAVLMPETTADEAALLGDRARTALEVGVSFGVSERGIDGSSLDELLRAADRRLYADKGRQAVAEGPPLPRLAVALAAGQ